MSKRKRDVIELIDLKELYDELCAAKNPRVEYSELNFLYNKGIQFMESIK